eukprot:3547863-Pleurochrysis_carterae.AAC.2
MVLAHPSECTGQGRGARSFSPGRAPAVCPRRARASSASAFVLSAAACAGRRYSSSMLAKGVNAHLVAHSAVLAPQER